MDGATVTIAGNKDFIIPIYRDKMRDNLLENWGKVGNPKSIPYEFNGTKVPGVEITFFTVQLKEGCRYVGPTDPDRPASSPEKRK